MLHPSVLFLLESVINTVVKYHNGEMPVNVYYVSIVDIVNKYKFHFSLLREDPAQSSTPCLRQGNEKHVR